MAEGDEGPGADSCDANGGGKFVAGLKGFAELLDGGGAAVDFVERGFRILGVAQESGEEAPTDFGGDPAVEGLGIVGRVHGLTLLSSRTSLAKRLHSPARGWFTGDGRTGFKPVARSGASAFATFKVD